MCVCVCVCVSSKNIFHHWFTIACSKRKSHKPALNWQLLDYFIPKSVTVHSALFHNISADNQCQGTDVISILASLNLAEQKEDLIGLSA